MALFDKFKRSGKDTDEVDGQVGDLAAGSEAGTEAGTEGDGSIPEDSNRTSLLGRFRRGKRKETGESPGEEFPDEEPAELERMEDAGDDAEAAENQRTSIFDKLMPSRKDTREQAEETPESDTGQDGAAPEGPPKTKVSLMERFKVGLTKTRKNIGDKIDNLIKSTRKLDDEFWEELEDILIQADVGMNTSLELVDKIRTAAARNKIKEPEEVTGLIKNEIAQLLGANPEPLRIEGAKPAVILVVGVNGAGKTTSIAKLAFRLKNENRQVMLAAGDTFRAAAIDQLQIWADRVGVELIKHQEGSDPGAVVFDAISAARARKADVLIVDTAGRLQNKANLMKEIGKVRRVIERELPEAPQEVLLVLDATTGQNAISQAKIFREATGVTGIILTKLDGTAKGGIVIAVAQELDIPVKMVGIGETLEDLRDFSPEVFAEALFAK
ncbi:MAG: signal recognition particle-docking protein FtsY [Syntrophomonadaceae bacterium]